MNPSASIAMFSDEDAKCVAKWPKSVSKTYPNRGICSRNAFRDAAPLIPSRGVRKPSKHGPANL